MRLRTFGYGCILMGLVFALCPFSRADGVGISVQQQALLELQANALATLVLTLESRRNDEQQFEERLIMPEGWQSLLPPETVVLPPNAVVQRSFLIRVPAAAKAAEYPLIYALESEHVALQTTVDVSVLPQKRISILSRDSTPEYVLPGESIHLPIRIVNEGNMSIDLAVQYRWSAPGSVVSSAQHLSVGAHDAEDLDFWLTPDVNIHRLMTAVFRLELVDIEDASRQFWRKNMQIVPHRSGDDPMIRFPLELQSTVGKQDVWQHQLQLSGSGFVDENERHQLSFTTGFSAPIESAQAIKLEHYWLQYEQDLWRLSLGDQWFRLSPLILPVRVGRGANAELKLGSKQLGVFTVSAEPQWEQSQTTAGYLSWSMHQDWRLRLQGLWTTGQTEQKLWGLQLRQQSAALRWMDIEWAASQKRNAPYSHYAARLNAQTDRVPGFRSFRLDTTYAMPQFFGAFSNLFDLKMIADIDSNTALRTRWSYRYFDRNIARDTSRGVVVTEQLWSSQWSWPVTQPWRVHWGYQLHQLKRLDSTWTHVGQAGLSYRHQNWYWQGRLNARAQEARGLRPTRFGGALSAQYRWPPYWRVRAEKRWWQRRMLRDAELLRDRQEFTLYAQWQPNSAWSFTGIYRKGTDSIKHPPEYLHSWSAQLQYQWHHQQRLRLQTQQTRVAQRDAVSSIELSYRIQLKAPLRHRPSIGSIYGQVLIRQGQEEVPAAFAWVQLEQQTVRTDAHGHYEIRSLAEGEYPIRVFLQQHSQQAFLQTEHQSVRIRSGERQYFPMIVVEPGRLVGHVKTAGAGQYVLSGWSASNNDLEQIQWLVSQDDVHHWVSKTPNGQFQLDGLNPGTWQVSLLIESLPRHWQMHPTQQTVVIESGREQALYWELSRVMPRLEWLDQDDPRQNVISVQ